MEEGVASRMGAMVSDIDGMLLTTISVAEAEAGSTKRFPPYVAFRDRMPDADESPPARGQQMVFSVAKAAPVAKMAFDKVEPPAVMLIVPEKFTFPPSASSVVRVASGCPATIAPESPEIARVGRSLTLKGTCTLIDFVAERMAFKVRISLLPKSARAKSTTGVLGRFPFTSVPNVEINRELALNDFPAASICTRSKLMCPLSAEKPVDPLTSARSKG